MASIFKRTDRIAEMMQRKLATLIQQEIKDPRLPKFITISGVTVTKDLAHAKVYFTLLKGDKNIVTEILNSSSGYLRTSLARTMTVRIVPQLHFIYDESLEYGVQLSKLIDLANPDHSDENSCENS